MILKEITTAQLRPRAQAQSRDKGKRRDWLVLLLREHLGTVPYISPTLTEIFPLTLLISGSEICDEHTNNRSPIRRLHASIYSHLNPPDPNGIS